MYLSNKTPNDCSCVKHLIVILQTLERGLGTNLEERTHTWLFVSPLRQNNHLLWFIKHVCVYIHTKCEIKIGTQRCMLGSVVVAKSSETKLFYSEL